MQNTAKYGRASSSLPTASSTPSVGGVVTAQPSGNPRAKTALVYTPISHTGLVQSIEIYKKSTRLIRPKLPSSSNNTPPVRTDIQGFSIKSRSRLCFLADNPAKPLCSQFGLTYHNRNPDGRTAKRHLNLFLNMIRKHYPDCLYLWIAEFQSRGVLHYHLFLTLPHDHEGFHKFLAESWHRIAEPDSPEHLRFHLHQKNFIAWDMCSTYLAHKYLSKAAQKDIPTGFNGMGRFWGSSRNLLCTPQVCTPANMAFLATEEMPNPFGFIIRNMGKLHERKIKVWQSKTGKKLWKSRIRKGCSSITVSNSVQGVKQSLRYLKTSYEKRPNLPF